MQELSSSRISPVHGHQLPYLSLTSPIASSVNTETFNTNTPRLLSSEGNTSWTNQPKGDNVPYIMNSNTKILDQKIQELNVRYEEMTMAMIKMQEEIETLKKTNGQCKSCPICLESVSESRESNASKKIAYFDCGHWICEACLIRSENYQFISVMENNQKQNVLANMLVEQFKDKRLISCSSNKIQIKTKDEIWIIHVGVKMNVYRDAKNNLIYAVMPQSASKDSGGGTGEEIVQNQKPNLHLLFNQTENIYVLQCPMCKVRLCYPNREDCYKLVYF